MVHFKKDTNVDVPSEVDSL